MRKCIHSQHVIIMVDWTLVPADIHRIAICAMAKDASLASCCGILSAARVRECQCGAPSRLLTLVRLQHRLEWFQSPKPK